MIPHFGTRLHPDIGYVHFTVHQNEMRKRKYLKKKRKWYIVL